MALDVRRASLSGTFRPEHLYYCQWYNVHYKVTVKTSFAAKLRFRLLGCE